MVHHRPYCLALLAPRYVKCTLHLGLHQANILELPLKGVVLALQLLNVLKQSVSFLRQ